MYLSELFVENFRLFGAQADGKHLTLNLLPGLNVLVGENDCGKTAIVDAIRMLLGTSTQDYCRLGRADFHVSAKGRASQVTVRATFSGLTANEKDLFLEHLTLDGSAPPKLYLTLAATLPRNEQERVRRSIRTGREGVGQPLEEIEKEYLEVTYLRPLRDAETALMGGKGSRLAQILLAHPDYQSQREGDFDPQQPTKQPKTLVGILQQAEHLIKNNAIVQQTQKTLNERFLQGLSLGNTPLRGMIGINTTSDIRQVLEKLDLALEPLLPEVPTSRRGLGLHNLLFIAAELLLLKEDLSSFPLLLLEEPEAHLHPQQQVRLIDFLQARSQQPKFNAEGNQKTETEEASAQAQIILTTHSPILASKVALENIVLLVSAQAFSLSPQNTQLEPGDYPYLARFLDATKANLFFARAVVLVEGDSENLLLPSIAERLGRSFSLFGVSVINVGTNTPIRYARIFQCKTGRHPPIRVACVRDRDLVPKSASSHVRPPANRKAPFYDEDLTPDRLAALVQSKRSFESENVKVFISPYWTLEYDLARSGLASEMYQAINIAEDEQERGEAFSDEQFATSLQDYAEEFRIQYSTLTNEEAALQVYLFLTKEARMSKPAVAQVLARIVSRLTPEEIRTKFPSYILQAIDFVTGVLQ